jgi:MmyB-like transcription regulator ligand binding domain
MAVFAGLGEFLRARRARLRPGDVGQPAGPGLRRTPGLRREELALFEGLAGWPPRRRNTVRYTFCHPTARELFADWPKTAASSAANLRTVSATDPGTPGLAAKTFRHPHVGTLTLSFEALHLEGCLSTRPRQAAPTTTRWPC